jgi:hypothetical protein
MTPASRRCERETGPVRARPQAAGGRRASQDKKLGWTNDKMYRSTVNKSKQGGTVQ